MAQLSNRTLGALTLTLLVACATNDTSNQTLSGGGSGNGGSSGSGGSAGAAGNPTATAGSSGNMGNGASGSAGAGGNGPAGAAGMAGMAGAAGLGGFGGFAGVGGAAGTAGGGAAGTAGGGAAGTAGGGAGGGGAAGTAGTAGTAGAGGAPVVVVDPCNRTNWVASALPTSGTDIASRAIDASAATRWSGGQDQEPGDYFQVVFPALISLDSLTLVSNAANDFPVGFKVQYSTDGTTFQDMMAGDGGTLTGAGVTNVPTVIIFPDATPMRGVRIVLNATSTYWWSIYNLTGQACLKYEAPDGGAGDAGDAG